MYPLHTKRHVSPRWQTPAGSPIFAVNRDFSAISREPLFVTCEMPRWPPEPHPPRRLPKLTAQEESAAFTPPPSLSPTDSNTALAPRKGWQDVEHWPTAAARVAYREYLAEFWGTLVMIFFGNGVVALSRVNQSAGGYLGITLGWGVAVTIGLYVSLGVSGGHLNSCVTVANAVWGKFPWRKVPGFILAQMLGAFVGAACAYGIYRDQLLRTTGGEFLAFGAKGFAGVFSTYPMPGNSAGGCIWSEFACSMLLLFCVSAIFDETNVAARGYEPVAVGLLVFAIGINIGAVTGYAMNPARDFGPRVFSALLFGTDVFTRDGYYFLIPLFVPFLGGTFGLFLYMFCVPQQTDDE